MSEKRVVEGEAVDYNDENIIMFTKRLDIKSRLDKLRTKNPKRLTTRDKKTISVLTRELDEVTTKIIQFKNFCAQKIKETELKKNLESLFFIANLKLFFSILLNVSVKSTILIHISCEFIVATNTKILKNKSLL